MLKNSLGAFCISVYVEEMILLLSNQESLFAPIALNIMLAFSTPLLYMATFTCEKKALYRKKIETLMVNNSININKTIEYKKSTVYGIGNSVSDSSSFKLNRMRGHCGHDRMVV